MPNSINTNTGQLVALRNLSRVNATLEQTQDRVSTGLKVIGPKDDASNFSIAQGIRGDIKAHQAVQQGLSQASGIMAAVIAGATTVSDLMMEMKKKAIEGTDPSLTATQRSILAADFLQLRDLGDTIVDNIRPGGFNLVDNGATAMQVVSDTQGNTITVQPQVISMVVLQFGLPNTDLNSVANAQQALGIVNNAQTSIQLALGAFGAAHKQIESQMKFDKFLTDALEEGLGSLVDADLGKESAKLQALQVQQQLSVQALGIANQHPQTLLGLFG